MAAEPGSYSVAQAPPQLPRWRRQVGVDVAEASANGETTVLLPSILVSSAALPPLLTRVGNIGAF